MVLTIKAGALISPAYLEEQRRLHAAPRGYGGKGDRWAEFVCAKVNETGAASLLDYGCGQGALIRDIIARKGSVMLQAYDPVTQPDPPFPADFVVCTDVLEHVEPEKLDAVLDHLQALTRKALFVVIATRECSKTLSDGRNAHINLHSSSWWRARLYGLFPRVDLMAFRPDKQFSAVCYPKESVL